MVPLVIFLVALFSRLKAEIEIDGVKVSTALECYRPCQENKSPKICYYSFTLEYYAVLGRACELCTPNNTNKFTADCQCVLADGIERGILTANRMIPGPSIQVCQNDTIIVDVRNQIPGMGVTLHWHGVWQIGTPWADGVPFVTQCPIHEDTTFRYKFVAGNEGTHFWHAHIGLQKVDGLTGTLIIRQPQNIDLSGHLYDYDLDEHVIELLDWMHQYASESYPGRLSFRTGQHPDSILINGKGQSKSSLTGCDTITPLEKFVVEPGKRYRFRLINAFGSVCPAQFTIENHGLTIIGSDGIALQPQPVDTIISHSGERYDFILDANHQKGLFWIQVKALGECSDKKTQQLAILHYSNNKHATPKSKPPTYDCDLPPGKILGPLDPSHCTDGSKRGVCVNQLRSVEDVRGPVPERPDIRFYAIFQMGEVGYTPGTYQTTLGTYDGLSLNGLINGISSVMPPSPLLQLKDITCNDTHKPQSCNNISCSCTHVYQVPMNAELEIVLIDGAPAVNLTHSFHLHGGVFEVIAIGTSPYRSPYGSLKGLNSTTFKIIEDKKLVKKNFDHPPSKDTIGVPYNGYVILRMKATNPGYWLFHCHFEYHNLFGMNLVFQIGTPEDMPPVPTGFPTCGNFKVPVK